MERVTGKSARARRGPGPAMTIAMLGPALAVTAVLFGGGLLLGVVQSLGYMPAAGLDTLTLDYFRQTVIGHDFAESLALTLYVSIMSTAIAAAISVALALMLHRLAGRARVARFVFQAPLTVPHLVIAVAVLFMLAPSGLIARFGAWIGIMDDQGAFPILTNDPWLIGVMAAYVWKEVPFITLMVLAALKSSGDDLLEAGRTLGAGRWQRFRFITLPVIFPSLGAASLIVFAYSFGAFEVPYILGRTHPSMLGVNAYKLFKDVEPATQLSGIATGIVIAGVVGLTVMLSQFITQAARRRGAAL